MMGGMRGGAPGQAPQRPNPWGSRGFNTGARDPQTGNLPGAQPGRMGNYQRMLGNQLRGGFMGMGGQPTQQPFQPRQIPMQQALMAMQRGRQGGNQYGNTMQPQPQPAAQPAYRQAVQQARQQQPAPSIPGFPTGPAAAQPAAPQQARQPRVRNWMSRADKRRMRRNRR